MKKLMIAAAIVCAAALSQAASVTWENPANWAYGTAVNINDGSGVAKAVKKWTECLHL